MSEHISHSHNMYRQPNSTELFLISYFTGASFPGSEEIKRQLQNVEVREIDGNGSIELKTTAPIKANVKFRVPIELYAKDDDDIHIHVLLHVVGGLCKEIEIYKDDSSKIKKIPTSWDVFVP